MKATALRLLAGDAERSKVEKPPIYTKRGILR